jgi:hypothetical protein
MTDVTRKAFQLTAVMLAVCQLEAMLLHAAYAQLPVGPNSVTQPSASAGPGYSAGRPEDYANPAGRRQIIIGPPISRPTSTGEIVVQPNLSIVDGMTGGEPVPVGTPNIGQTNPPPESVLVPSPALNTPGEAFETLPAPYTAPPVAEPIFDEFVSDVEQIVTDSPSCHAFGPLCWLRQRLTDHCGEIGIGHERVMFALFEMDVSQPLNHFRFRLDSAYDVEFPDRAEYMWSKQRGPPLPEIFVDYQELRFLYETGGPRFSVQTEIPIRGVDPVVNGSSAGMGDMSLTTKTVLVDGEIWQITQLFRTFFPTGSASRGTGTGFVSMELGCCGHYKLCASTYLHGEITYWFPLGADPTHSGQVLEYGIGASHLLLDTDKFAAIPTLEIVGWGVMDGMKTLPNGLVVPTDSDYIFNIYPGLRVVLDNNSDLGLWEFGIAGGFRVSNQHFYKGLLRVEMQFSW